MNIAIVTGASSGLGSEFVAQIDRYGYDEIWVIARRKARLEQLQQGVKTKLRILSYDLCKQESFDEIRALLKQVNPSIRLLINAAGYGKMGNYADISFDDNAGMIDLNCKAAVLMTKLCLDYMDKGSMILQVASTSAFQPLPYLNVYSASKAFLYRYSRSLRIELLPRGIHCTALCPYWIKDTEFIDVSKKNTSASAIRHFPLASRKKNVVRRALFDVRYNLPVSTPGPVCSLHRLICKFIPSEIMMGLWSLIRRI